MPSLSQAAIERPILLEKLNLAHHHKLTLIAAPPGYGKTTLLAQFVRQAKYPVAWHTVEKRERDLPELFAQSFRVLSSVVTSIQDVELRARTAPVEAAVLVTDRLRSALQADIFYVVDDVHYLMGSPRAEKWLQTFIAEIPPTCHVILIGRALPTLPLMEMVARREVLAIGQEQLRFTFDELQGLAEKLGVALPPSEIQVILARFDGWVAGSILALQPLPREVERAVFSSNRGPEALFNALAEMMLHAQDPALQDFLLASSTLARMTPTLCQNALHLLDSHAQLSAAVSRNLFITQGSGGLTYHPLFRDFLQRHLKQHDPVRFTHFHLLAGRWFEDSNQLEEAFDHYSSAQAWDAAAAIAERTAQIYFSQGKPETVLEWRAQLDGTGVDVPQLLYACATIYVDRYQFDEANEALAGALKGFQRRRDDIGILKVILLQANIDNLRGQHRQAIQRTEGLTDRFSIPANLQGYLAYILGTSYLHLGEIQTALQHLNAALPLYRDAGDAYALSQLLLTLELANMRVGRFEEATAYLQEAISIRRSFGSSAGLAMPLNNLGYDYHLIGEYQQAYDTFQEGLAVARRLGDRRVENHLLWSLGDLQRDRGAFDEALSHYQSALRQVGSHDPALRCGLLVSISTLQRWQKNLEAARQSAAEAVALAEQYNLPFERIKAQVAQWAVHLQQSEEEEIRRELKTLAEAFLKRESYARWAQTLVLYAAAALRAEDRVAAHDLLKSIVADAGHISNLQPSIAEIVHTPVLKDYLYEHSTRFPELIKGVARLETECVDTVSEETFSSVPEQMVTYSLRLWTLGQERIERDGAAVPISAWRSSTARELFFYLLFKGATPREQLGLVLWPDSSPRQVRQKFHTTLRRVRNAVGMNAVQFEDELYFLNLDVDIWCDAVEFETLIQQARLTSPLRAHTENLWRRAVDLYAGDLLVSFDADWIMPQREAWHHMYLEAILSLGNCLRLRGSYHDAIATYQRVLEIDPYREDAHRMILTCYAALGARSSIHQHMEMLTRLLETDLGVDPSVETLSLAKSLMH